MHTPLGTSSPGKYRFFLCSIIFELGWAFHECRCRSGYPRTCACKWHLLLCVLNLNSMPLTHRWSAFLYGSVVLAHCMFGPRVPSASCSEAANRIEALGLRWGAEGEPSLPSFSSSVASSRTKQLPCCVVDFLNVSNGFEQFLIVFKTLTLCFSHPSLSPVCVSVYVLFVFFFLFVCIFVFLFGGLCILSPPCGAVLRCRIRPALPLQKPLKPASQWASAVPPPQSAQAPPWGLGPPQIRWKTSSQRHTNLLACYPNPATFGQKKKNVHGTQPGEDENGTCCTLPSKWICLNEPQWHL